MPRTVKPDPNDPTWAYPYASRARIEALRAYFERFKHTPKNWHDQKRMGIRTRVLPANRKIKIPWESVPPHMRERTQQWFDAAVAKVIEERGFITEGKRRSLRMNAANIARHYWNGESRHNRRSYNRHRADWLRYKTWEAQQEMKNGTPAMP